MKRDEVIEGARARLPGGVTLFDIHSGANGMVYFFIDTPDGRDTIAITGGDALVPRFLPILEGNMKEKGMKKGASKMAKAMDEKMDKKLGMMEGSKADLKTDKAAMKKFPAKKGK